MNAFLHLELFTNLEAISICKKNWEYFWNSVPNKRLLKFFVFLFMYTSMEEQKFHNKYVRLWDFANAVNAIEPSSFPFFLEFQRNLRFFFARLQTKAAANCDNVENVNNNNLTTIIPIMASSVKRIIHDVDFEHILLKIFLYLDGKTIESCSAVSKTWRGFIKGYKLTELIGVT